MKLIISHDVRIYKKNNFFYTSGGINDNRLKKYKFFFDEIKIISRQEEIKEDSSKRLNQITLENISFLSVKNIRNIFSKKFQKMLKINIENSDAIIALLPSFIGLNTLYYAKKLKKPYLIELLGCPKEALWNRSFIGKIIALFLYYLTKKNIKESKFCLYVTNKFLQNRYPTNGFQVGISDVILNENSDFQDILEKRKEKIEEKIQKNQKIIIGTLGAIDVKYKGQQFVIKALSKILDKEKYEYQIVGPGDEKFLKKIIEKYKLEKNVKIKGSISHEKIFEWLDNIDIYIQPSKTEGLPRALVEAMSRGCLCLGSNVGGIPELLDKKYLFKSESSNEIKQKLLEISKIDLKKEAEKNLKISEKFQSKILDYKRNEFYLKFFKCCKENKINKI